MGFLIKHTFALRGPEEPMENVSEIRPQRKQVKVIEAHPDLYINRSLGHAASVVIRLRGIFCVLYHSWFPSLIPDCVWGGAGSLHLRVRQANSRKLVLAGQTFQLSSF